jgi:hypothetical protein
VGRGTPAQLYGIEINEYAYELAQMTIQIGYIQWLRDNGYGLPGEPILRQVKNIRHMDAIMTPSASGTSPKSDSIRTVDRQSSDVGFGGGWVGVEPEWPAVDVIIGNPPFLGDKKMRAELGHEYVEDLRKLYGDRIPGQSDLVCYWFEKARAMIESGKAKRVGLLATNSIRGGANRRVLERIKETGNIYWAQSDREWILDGAAVNVSMVGFDNGDDKEFTLDNSVVININPDLSSSSDITTAQKLAENFGVAYIGDSKKGKFEITEYVAQQFLANPHNPNGKPNMDVIVPWANGLDITNISTEHVDN